MNFDRSEDSHETEVLESFLRGMEFKVFNDSTHGFIALHPLLVVVTDTPQVQRLRNIKQLSVCCFVFPTATHSRFEHSIGTAFLAGKLFDNLKQKRLPSDLTDEASWEKKKLCAQIAGLCHDVGHGPFSHMWEEFRHRVGDKWTHEEESIKIFNEILNEEISPLKKFGSVHLEKVRDAFDYYGLTQNDISIIKKMIMGVKNERNYLFQVISNKNNGIDVDKWDYLARDSFMLNIPTGFDCNRLLNYCCILRNENGEEQIGFRDKECSVLADMFLARGKLHDDAYQHTKVKIIEEMFLDAFVLANDRLQLSTTPIAELTDHIYQKILYENFENDQKMKKAKEILRRVERRHLYKLIAQEAFQGRKPDDKEIIEHLRRNLSDIEPFIDDIGIISINVHMTKFNRNKPLKNVLVYQKFNCNSYIPKNFDWDKHQNSLKLNLEHLKRDQILLLYKGTLEFPDQLQARVAEQLKLVLEDFASKSA